jgi:hypothetical protein
MTYNRIAIAACALSLVGSAASAQAPQGASRSQTPASSAPPVTVQPTLTLTGCLYPESQVPGRKPNVAERAGILEDYILADASTKPASTTPGATGTSGTAPVTGNMYKVEKIADEQLKALVGKRVEVTGRIDPEGSPAVPDGARPDRGLSGDSINLPEFEASSIHQIAGGACPATPAPIK